VTVVVPSGLAAVVLFIVLLWPGFAYSSVRARRRPDRRLTPLQETVSIVTASLMALALTGVLFGIIRVLWPGGTPDVGRLLFHPHAYLEANYVRTGWWAAGFMAVAVLGSAGVAAAQSSDRLGRVRGLSRLVAPPDPSTMSSWWIAFSNRDSRKVEIHVGCTLDDGSYVSGRLYSFSQVADDNADRDLLLRDPISVRPARGSRATVVDRAGLMAISARHILTMTVTYVGRPAPSAVPPSPAPPSVQESAAAPAPGPPGPA
jgi:hypothetical protein